MIFSYLNYRIGCRSSKQFRPTIFHPKLDVSVMTIGRKRSYFGRNFWTKMFGRNCFGSQWPYRGIAGASHEPVATVNYDPYIKAQQDSHMTK